MSGLQGFSKTPLQLPACQIDMQCSGSGKPLLFLHPGEGLLGAQPFLERLASSAKVFAPSHPGFGQSELPSSISTVDDLAFAYLDLLDALALNEVILVGASFGGWIAAEIAVRNTSRLSHLVLIDSLGIKIGDRYTRDIVDMHALGRDALAAHLYANPSKYAPDFVASPPELAVAYARDRESFTYFGWQPYMHNPKLRQRLHRINIPSLVLWGEFDAIVNQAYGQAFADAIPGARFSLISQAGHMSHVENAHATANAILAFAGLAEPDHI